MKILKNKIELVLGIIAAAIMLQTLYYKFSASPESVFIFTSIGMEPFGRLGIGVGELLASVLILFRKTNWIGAILAAGLMGGAIFFHVTKLGISVMDDGGQLFVYAIIVLISSLILIFINRKKVPILNKLIK